MQETKISDKIRRGLPAQSIASVGKHLETKQRNLLLEHWASVGRSAL